MDFPDTRQSLDLDKSWTWHEVSSPLHIVHFGYYDGPVVKMALYMLQGHIM